MKMTKPDYTRMEELINDTVETAGITITDTSISAMRYRWSIHYAVLDWLQYNSRDDYIFIRGLYEYCNDDHIDTALRRIVE